MNQEICNKYTRQQFALDEPFWISKVHIPTNDNSLHDVTREQRHGKMKELRG